MLWNVSKLFIIIFSTNAINPFVKLLLPNKSDYLLYASFLVLYNSICWRWKTTRYFDTTISTQMLSFSIIMASRMLQRKQIIFDLAKSTNYLFTRNFFFYLLSIGDGTNGGAGGGGIPTNFYRDRHTQWSISFKEDEGKEGVKCLYFDGWDNVK